MNVWPDLDSFLGSMNLLRNRMDRLFGDFDRSWFLLPGETADNYPRTNFIDDGAHLTIEAEVPGFTRDELNIRIEGNYLEMSGNRNDHTPEGYTSQRRERQATGFSRSFTLPADIDHDRVAAFLKNGILTLTLPKAEATKPRQIKIK